MKKTWIVLLALMLAICGAAQGERTEIDRRDGQVHFLLSGDAFDGTRVTPFKAHFYHFDDSERIARIFFRGKCQLAQRRDIQRYDRIHR